MKRTKMLTILVLALGLIVCQAKVSEAVEMGTAFTYQGHLYDNNDVANGLYDFQFSLYDVNVGGAAVANDVNVHDMDIIDGYFTVELDFGSEVFDGNARWLEIGIRPGEMNDPNVYTQLSPRQEVTPVPYALQTRGIFVDEAGDVGIGTTYLWGPKLNLAGGFGVTKDGSILFETGHTGNVMKILNQNVGIGTTSPAEKLDVAGTGQMTGFKLPTGASSGYVLTSDASGVGTWQAAAGGGDSDWTISDGNMYTGAGVTGNVGVGTTSPGAKLDVEVTSGGAATIGSSLNSATGDYAIATGYSTNASDYSSTAMGYNTTASGYSSTAMGRSTDASGHASTAMGYNTTASGVYSTAMGYDTDASGYASTAMGRLTTASGYYSTAMGREIEAQGDFSVAIALNNDQNGVVVSQANTMAIMGGNVGIGTISPQGTLDVNGPIYQSGGVLHADYVFEPDYELESIDEHSEFMWQQKHLPAIPKAKVNDAGQEIVEVGAHRKGIVEELEKAHIYIEQLYKENQEIKKQLAEMQNILSQPVVQQKGRL